jgi:hypothetical protein
MGLLDSLLSYVDSRKRVAGSNLADIRDNPLAALQGLLSSTPETVAERERKHRETSRRLQSGGGLLGGSVMPGVDKVTDSPEFEAAMMGIVSPKVANKLKFETRLPSSPEFSEAVANTRGAQIIPEGLLMRVQRNQLPEQGMSESVRGGVFYLPEGAQQAKFYSTGKSGYGGAERITGETLVKNPLFAKGGTGGKAPERAYDSLMGIGAYQKMRDDALQVGNYRGWEGGGSWQAGVKRAEEFLTKHAPEMSGYGEYILEHSRKGNTLAYALQEAAVASAARNAGHDAVLGYSKGKSGNFLSELFDVRESHYPDKFGGSRVWEELFK